MRQVVRTVPGIKLPRLVRPILRGKEVEFHDTRCYDVGRAGPRAPCRPDFAHSVHVHTRCIRPPGLTLVPVSAQLECLLTVYQCTRTHSLHPHPWPGYPGSYATSKMLALLR